MPSRKIWAMWAIASIFYAYQYILRVMPNVTMSDIMAKYQIDAAVFGQFSGIYYLGYTAIHLPLGILLDRFGPKKIMPLFMMLTVVGLAPLVWSEFWVYPLVGRALIGIGSSSAILGVFKIIRMIFAEEKFTWMLSLSVTVGLLGAIYGGAPVLFIREALGFEQLVLCLMATGVVVSILTYLILPDYEPAEKQQGVLKNIAVVFGNKRVIAICFLAGLMVGPLEGFADVWGTTFLRQVYGIEDVVAASLPSVMYVGMCIGGPVLSLFAAKASPLLVILGCALAMAAAFFTMLFAAPPVAALTVIFFVVGMLCAYQILAIAYASTLVPLEVAGLTNAVANMIIMSFGYVFHAIIGTVIGYFTGPIEGAPMTAEALVYGVSTVPIALMISACGFAYLMRTKKQNA